MGNLSQDFKMALRRLVKHPGMTAVIVLTMAICLGAGTALFSVVESVLLDPWPYVGFDRIVTFRGNYPVLGETERGTWSIPELRDIAAQTHVFDHVMTGQGRDVNLTEGEVPERVLGAAVTASAFPMLGVEPAVGRVFSPREDQPGTGGVVVMSHGLWQRRFGGDPAVVGTDLEIEGETYEVVGVMPYRFRWWNSDLWFPLMLDTTAADRTARTYTIQARLRPGVEIEQAEAELNALARRWESEYGAEVPEYRGLTFDLNYLAEGVLGEVRPALFVLLGFVGLVFVVGCVNVASLLMAQAIERRQEIAVYLALGSERMQLLRRLLMESLLRALLGGALGFLLAYWGLRFIVGLIPAVYIPAETEIELDFWALGFAFVASVIAAGLFGLIPALHAVSVSQGELIKQGGTRSTGGRRARRVRSALVVAEVALATVVLMAAGLMIRSYMGLVDIDPGFDPENVVTARVDLPEERYPEAQQVETFFRQLTDRVEALPGVRAVAATSSLPLGGGTPTAPVTIEGRSAQDVGAIPTAAGRIVRPGYFGTLDVPILQGRDFALGDTMTSQPVVIVNQTMARRFWGSARVVGERFKIGGADSENPFMTVVAVVGDVLNQSLEGEPEPIFYLPHTQRADRVRGLALVARTAVPPEQLVEPIRDEVTRLDPSQPVHSATTLERIWLESLGAKPLAVTLLSVFAAIAIVLALVGIFAMMAYTVSRQSGEIGIRMAMGAGRRDVVQAFLKQGVLLTVVGILIGLGVGTAASRTIAGFVYGIGTFDPVTFAVAAVGFCLLGALGSYIASSRAARVQPAVALRRE